MSVSAGELWSKTGMVECMQAMTQPAARSEKCACLMQGARQGKMHFDTNIYKTKKVRKSKTMMNQHIQSLCRHVSWSSRWSPNAAPDNLLVELSQYECILEAAGNQRILSKLCILLGATGILLLLNTLLFRYFYRMRDERGFHLMWSELPALTPDE